MWQGKAFCARRDHAVARISRSSGLPYRRCSAKSGFVMVNNPLADQQPRGFNAAYDDVRQDDAIQFEPKVDLPQETPDWIKNLLDWLAQFAEPVSQFLTSIWPILRYALIALLIIGILALLYALLRPYYDAWRGREMASAEPQWRPDSQIARALLEEADRLAADGRYDEAAHLLLFRSIEDIEKTRRTSFRASVTAREIGAMAALSDTAKAAFGVIAGYVEESLFAQRPLDGSAWTKSRAAYSDFALDKRA